MRRLPWPWVGGAGSLLGLSLLPLVVTGSYSLHILIMIGINAILASGLDLVVGHLELLSLGHAAFFGIGAYASALLHLNLGLSFWQALPIAGLTTGLLGFLIGLVTLRLRGPYFVIVTLGFGQILYIIFLNWVELTRGPMGLPGIQGPTVPFRPDLPFDGKVPFYYLILALCLLTWLLKRQLASSYIGRAWRSIREDENLAASVGVSAFRYALLAFTIGAGLAGVAGSFYAHYILFVSPELFEFSNAVAILVMVIFGGRATLWGPVVGAVLFTVLLEYLRIAGGLRLPILALVLILTMMFFPGGIANMVQVGGGVARAVRRKILVARVEGAEIGR